MMHRRLAAFADHPDQALSHDAIQGRNKVIGFDAHVDEAPDDVRDVIGMHGGEDKVTGKRRLDGDLSRLFVANFADHDFVRVVTQNGSQAAGKGEPLFLVYRDLRDSANLVFHWIFDGDDLILVSFDLVDGGIERGRLTGTGGAGNQNHAVRLVNVAAKSAQFFSGEADHFQAEIVELLRERLLIQHTQDGVLAVNGRHDGNAKIHKAALVAHAEAAILGHAAFGDIQFAHYLDAGEDGGVPFFGDRRHGMHENPVNPVLHDHFHIARFDVNITSAPLQRGKNNRIHQTHDRADATLLRKPFGEERLFTFVLVLDHLERKRLRGLLEHALRLLGALEQIANLRGRGHLQNQLLSQKQR